MALCLVGEGDADGVRVQLVPRRSSYQLLVGRAPDSDLVLSNRSVSGRHARIEVQCGRGFYKVLIRDYGDDGSGSRFGSLINEDHVKGSDREVRLGDKVCFGTTKYGAHFRVEAQEEEDNDDATQAVDQSSPGFSRDDERGWEAAPLSDSDADRGEVFLGPNGVPLRVSLADGLGASRDGGWGPRASRYGRRSVDGGNGPHRTPTPASGSSGAGRGRTGGGTRGAHGDKPWRGTPGADARAAEGRGGAKKPPSPPVSLAFPTANGVVVRDSRDPWPDGFGPGNAAGAGGAGGEDGGSGVGPDDFRWSGLGSGIGGGHGQGGGGGRTPGGGQRVAGGRPGDGGQGGRGGSPRGVSDRSPLREATGLEAGEWEALEAEREAAR